MSSERKQIVEALFRDLGIVWSQFAAKLDQTPMFQKLRDGQFTVEDYKKLLINHRQQVVDGGRWITRAASSIDAEFEAARSMFIQHAATEHRDFKMLEQAYVHLGGSQNEIISAPKNIGTEAFTAFMFHRASQPNPFDLLGAMFIIEGLGERRASSWADQIQAQTGVGDEAVQFFRYHGEHDEDHMEDFERVLLEHSIVEIPNMTDHIVKTAKVVARLYCLQIEEIDNV